MTLRRVLLVLSVGCVLALAALYRARWTIYAYVNVPVYDAFSLQLSKLEGADVINPTTLQFGPDGRLYVATRFGLIHRLAISETADGGFRVNRAERISSILEILNHDDRGNPLPHLRRRLVTGMFVTGTAERPVLFVSSSDPRLEDPEIDTNSGVVSRVDRTPAGWQRTDLVRGLPRSRYDHAPNGIALDETRNLLYVSVASLTNSGAPSSRFLLLPEYPVAGAILRIDLNRIGGKVYDLPTLDDPARSGSHNAGDPFGGNGGRNHAVLDPAGPVSIFATGLRNAYDLALVADGLLTIDNGPNADFGGLAGPDPCLPVEGGLRYIDALHWIWKEGMHLGHPNPARLAWDPRESRLIPSGQGDGAIATFSHSTNGFVIHAAASPGRIEVLAVSLDRSLYRLVLDRHSRRLISREVVLSNFGGSPLDVWIQDARSVFPGSIWIADMTESSVFVLIPRPRNVTSFVRACRSWVFQSLKAVGDAAIEIKQTVRIPARVRYQK